MYLISPVYYVQTNVFCILIFILLLITHARHTKANTTETVMLKRLIYMTMAYCVSDIGAWLVNGAHFPGTAVMLQVSNIIYIGMPAVFAYIWLQYLYVKLYNVAFQKTAVGKIMIVPLATLILLLLLNPVIHLTFTIDENNIYHRGILAYCLPIVCLIYLVFSIVQTWRFISNEQNKIRRDDARPMILFVLPLLVTSAIQLCFYGLTVSQIGFTFGILLIYLNMQYDKISIDELTGLNNRRELKQYLYGMMNSDKTESLFLCMIDVDFFKTINDTWGHMEGDIALKTVATSLKKVCGNQKQRVFLARYGGDEFIISGTNYSDEELLALKKQLLEEIKDVNNNSDKLYKLSLSIGYASGTPSELKTYETLLKRADEQMYIVKKARKVGR